MKNVQRHLECCITIYNEINIQLLCSTAEASRWEF